MFKLVQLIVASLTAACGIILLVKVIPTNDPVLILTGVILCLMGVILLFDLVVSSDERY